jgi:hypothetical protein
MRPHPRCVLLCMILVAPVVVAGAAPGTARESLERLAARQELRLLSRPGNRDRSFGLTWHMPRDAQDAQRVQIVVEAGPSGAAALIQEGGLPYAYVTDGLFAMLDSHRPGKLLVTENIQLEFDVGLSSDGRRLHFGFGCGPMINGGWVDVDFPTVLRILAARGGDAADTDPRTGVIRVPLPNIVFRVQPSVAPEAPFAIQSFSMEPEGGAMHTLDGIWIGPRREGSILGLTLQHLRASTLQLVNAEKADVPRQLPLPPRDFFAVPGNRTAGEEFRTLIRSLPQTQTRPDPAVHPASQPLAPAGERPASRFDPQRAETKLMFDGLWRILAGVDLSPQQTAEVKAALAVGQARFEEIIGQLEQRDADAEALRRALLAAGERLIENLREPLTDAQDSRFAAAWLVFINEDADRASVYNLLGVIAAGVLELDLPDKQRREAVEPLWDAWRRMERLRGQVQAGELRQAEAVRRVLEVTNALMGQLERVLGPDLYRKLDEYVRRHADPRLLRPRSD